MNMTPSVPKGDPLDRALAAYYRSAALAGAQAIEPSPRACNIETVAGKDYVVLRNNHGVLAVYRVRTSGVLKRLTRWPSELES